MKKRMKKFLFLGFEKEMLIKFHKQIDEYNGISLLTANYALTVFMLLASIYVTFLLPNAIKSIMCLSMCLSGIIIVIYLKKNIGRQSHLRIECLISWTMLLCYACGIWMGSFGSEGRLAVSCILIFAMIPVYFIRLPMKNIALLLPSVIVFWLCSYHTKEKPIFLYDVLHSTMGMICGVGISCSLSHSKIGNIISTWKLRETNEALYLSSITDALTGLSNRVRTMEILTDLSSHPTSAYLMCIVLDIDNFKAYNDTYGHPEGDTLLRSLGETLKNYGQFTGMTLGRIGGEEFMAVCETDSVEFGRNAAAGLRRTVEGMAVPHRASDVSAYVTVSIGLFLVPANDEMILKAYTLADQALYYAKNNGRNCCWQYDWESKSFMELSS